MIGNFQVTMPDGSRWAVPIEVIARNRAEQYAHEYDGDAERSYVEDTVPLFLSDDYEIVDWATNNMNWEDVEMIAKRLVGPRPVDYQEGWVNGEHKIVGK